MPKSIPHPTQRQVLEASCGLFIDLPLNMEVMQVHWGEDGPGLAIETLRRFSITEQCPPAELQPWALYELYESYDEAPQPL